MYVFNIKKSILKISECALHGGQHGIYFAKPKGSF